LISNYNFLGYGIPESTSFLQSPKSCNLDADRLPNIQKRRKVEDVEDMISLSLSKRIISDE